MINIKKRNQSLIKTIKKIIGRLNCPPTKVVPNKKRKKITKLKEDEIKEDSYEPRIRREIV